ASPDSSGFLQQIMDLLFCFYCCNPHWGICMNCCADESAAASASGKKSTQLAVFLFPVIITLAGLFGTFVPSVASAVNPLVVPLLGLVMLCMGLSIKPVDLKIIVAQPQAVIIGCVAQYVIMPLSAWVIGTLLQLPPQVFVGLVLLGTVPGGTSSNIVAFLARGNVALSVAMTSISTIISPFLTPLIVLWLAGHDVPVDAAAMLKRLCLLLRYLGKRVIARILPAIPWVSVIVLSVVIAGIMAGSAKVIFDAALASFVAVVLQNAVGFALGWSAAYAGKLSSAERRAVAVE